MPFTGSQNPFNYLNIVDKKIVLFHDKLNVYRDY